MPCPPSHDSSVLPGQKSAGPVPTAAVWVAGTSPEDLFSSRTTVPRTAPRGRAIRRSRFLQSDNPPSRQSPQGEESFREARSLASVRERFHPFSADSKLLLQRR